METHDFEHLLTETGALLSGHFRLSSGLHSGNYVQCARLLQFPNIATQIGQDLADELKKHLTDPPDFVAAPAIGGILIAHEVARAFGVRCLFTEREGTEMKLRRGFQVETGERAIVIEDVVTTGGSTRETMATLEKEGAQIIAVGSIIDRSSEPVDLGIPRAALIRLQIPSYKPDACPLCQAGMAVVKPGSRKMSE
ncbi:MAG: orotate phosphoribosyltransferase [Acidobacteria bacterium]|nr:orotate phosphoribosyltransferase [Acidobacteriota bacterium]